MLSGGFDKVHDAGCEDPNQRDARKVVKRCTAIIDGSKWTDSEKLRARFYRGLANAVMGKFDQVVEDLNLYIAGFSDDGLALKARGLAFEALGNRLKAIEDYSEIVRRSFYDDMPWARAALRRLGAPNPETATPPPTNIYPLPQAAAAPPVTTGADEFLYVPRAAQPSTPSTATPPQVSLELPASEAPAAARGQVDPVKVKHWAELFLKEGRLPERQLTTDEAEAVVREMRPDIVYADGTVRKFDRHESLIAHVEAADRKLLDYSAKVQAERRPGPEIDQPCFRTGGKDVAVQAIEECTKLIADSSIPSAYYMMRAGWYSLLRERELMMADFERAEQTAISETVKSSASALKRLAVADAEWSDARAGALLDFTYLLDKNPNDAAALLLRGFYFFDVGAYADALKDVSRSIEIDPSDTKKYILRALLHGKLKAYEESLADYNVAIERAPDNASLRVHRSILLAILDQPFAAVADMNEYLKKEPVPAPMRALYLIIRAMNRDALLLRNEAMIVADYKAALALDPDVDIPESTRARFEQAKEAQLRLAAEPIQRRTGAGAAVLDPEDLKAKYIENVFSGRHAQLIEDCTAYIQLRPADVACYRLRGNALAALGRFEKALADYRRAEEIETAPNVLGYISEIEDAMAGWNLPK